MNRLDDVITSVKQLYSQPNSVIDWNEWVYEGHIKIVAEWVEKISQKYDFNKEICLAAAYLHDLA